jgi:hypothetical protein
MATAHLITPSIASHVGQAAACFRRQMRATRNALRLPRLFRSPLTCDHGGDRGDARRIDAEPLMLPSNVTFAIESTESRCLRTLRPFLTHFDPQRHRGSDDTRRVPAHEGVLLCTGTGRCPEQTATSISTQYPQSRYTTINQAGISVWHDTRFCKVPFLQLIPVTDAKLHGKRREQAGLGKKFPGILAHCLSDAQCGGRLVDVSRGPSALMPERPTRAGSLPIGFASGIRRTKPSIK